MPGCVKARVKNSQRYYFPKPPACPFFFLTTRCSIANNSLTGLCWRGYPSLTHTKGGTMRRTALRFIFGAALAAAPFSTSFAQAPYGKGLTYEMAGKCIAAAHAEAKKNNWFMVTSVVDDGGHLVALGRMDNAQIA